MGSFARAFWAFWGGVAGVGTVRGVVGIWEVQSSIFRTIQKVRATRKKRITLLPTVAWLFALARCEAYRIAPVGISAS